VENFHFCFYAFVCPLNFLHCSYITFNIKKITKESWALWLMPVIPVFGRLRQEDHGLKASLGCIARPCLKNKMTKEKLSHISVVKPRSISSLDGLVQVQGWHCL
jgi:hypothetical protein